MHPDPVHPPTSARGGIVSPARASVVTVNADGTLDVRLFLSRGGKARVPKVSGLVLAVGDQVLLELVDGDPNVPLVTAKVPPGAFK